MTGLNKQIKTKPFTLAEKLADKVRFTPTIFNAFASIDRENFVPNGFTRHAYELDALPISGDQWISSPLTVAKMTVALNPEHVDSVLEIGCGSGYQAAILSKLFRRVFAIERIEKLYIDSKKRFKAAGIINVNVKHDDGQKGWKTFAKFDRIIFSAYAKEIPKTLFDQLENGGILVAPMEVNNKQIITRFTKNGETIEREELGECLFVPILDGIEK